MVGYRHEYDAVCQDAGSTLSRNSLSLSAGSAGHALDGVDAGHSRDAADNGAMPLEAGLEAPAGHEFSRPQKPTKEVIGWKDLPKKDQLLVITLARLSEPLTQTSLQVTNTSP